MSKETVEGWEIAVTKRRVHTQRSKWTILNAEGFDDLVQECLLHWLQAKKKYDPTRGASIKTFMALVVTGHLSTIKDKLLAEKRRAFFEAVSLHDIMDEDVDSPLKIYKDKMGEIHDSSIEIDLSLVLQKLTPQQKEICHLIKEKGMSFHQISKHLNKHSRYVTRELDRIRNVFQVEGLRGYLE